MKAFANAGFVALLSLLGFSQSGLDNSSIPVGAVLNQAIKKFEINDAIMRDGVAQLSSTEITGLHLGFEEVVRDGINIDPRSTETHFSLKLDKTTVQQVLNSLCDSDSRYTWSVNGLSIDIYPKRVAADRSYLFNRKIKRINLAGVPDPNHALTPLSHLLPDEQIGYMGIGLGDNTYAEPWTVSFEHVRVRQLINRLAEHLGPRGSWVWQGGKDERMFTFATGSFHTRPAN